MSRPGDRLSRPHGPFLCRGPICLPALGLPAALGLLALGLFLLALPRAGLADAAGPGAGYGAHLASYFGRADAERGWRILQRRLPAALGDRSPVYRQVEVRGRSYVRLMAGPFPTAQAARDFCTGIRADWNFCEVLSLADGRPVSAPAATAPAAPSQPSPTVRTRTAPAAPTPAAPATAPAQPEPPVPLPAERPAVEPVPDRGTGPDRAAGPEDDPGRLRFDSAALPAPPAARTRPTPQQRAIFRSLEGNWIQYDGDCRSDLSQIGEGAIRRIAGGVPQPAMECEARREGATVALFCPEGREFWFEVINEDELVFRRSRPGAGAEYESVDQLLSRCQAG